MHPLDALGNPVRREILRRLQAKPMTVREIAALFPVSRPAISRHLRVLSDAGLVQATPEGASERYAVRIEGFEPVREYLERFWESALARLQALAEDEP